jgi:hypothetical protein
MPVLNRDYSPLSSHIATEAFTRHPVSCAIGNSRPVKRPYWVRCFVVDGRARLIDPPVLSLKET